MASSSRGIRCVREAVARVPDVTEQEVEVVGYVGAKELNAMLKESD